MDTRTETLIQRALDQLLRGRTSFVIAHRLSTIQDAEQVPVLDEGRIVERGTHKELLAAQGLYRRLHSSQFRRQAEAVESSRVVQPSGPEGRGEGPSNSVSGWRWAGSPSVGSVS